MSDFKLCAGDILVNISTEGDFVTDSDLLEEVGRGKVVEEWA